MLNNCFPFRDRLIYTAVGCVNQYLDLNDALLCSPSPPQYDLFKVAFPIVFATHFQGRSFRMNCLWHSSNEEKIQMGRFYHTDLGCKEEFKRCFLLRHEVINIVIKTAQMTKALFEVTGRMRGPRMDMWWWKFCICQKRYNKGDKLIKCSGCKNWFHKKCVRMPSGHCGKCQTKHI